MLISRRLLWKGDLRPHWQSRRTNLTEPLIVVCVSVCLDFDHSSSRHNVKWHNDGGGISQYIITVLVSEAFQVNQVMKALLQYIILEVSDEEEGLASMLSPGC